MGKVTVSDREYPQRGIREPAISADDARNRFHAARNAHATARVWQLATDQDVDIIVLKGVTTHALRSERAVCSVDVDVLVDPHHRRVLSQVLLEQGYHRRRGSHGDTWFGPNRDEIDVHYSLCRAGASPQVVWSVLWTHTQWFCCAGQQIRILNPSARLIVLAVAASQGRTDVTVPDLSAAVAEASAEELDASVAIASSLGLSGTVAWALELADLPMIALRFGVAQCAVTDPAEAGWIAYLTSPVHPFERRRKLPKIASIALRRRLAKRWPHLAWDFTGPAPVDPDDAWLRIDG